MESNMGTYSLDIMTMTLCMAIYLCIGVLLRMILLDIECESIKKGRVIETSAMAGC